MYITYSSKFLSISMLLSIRASCRSYIIYKKNHPCQPVMILTMVLTNNLKTKTLLEFNSYPPPNNFWSKLSLEAFCQ